MVKQLWETDLDRAAARREKEGVREARREKFCTRAERACTGALAILSPDSFSYMTSLPEFRLDHRSHPLQVPLSSLGKEAYRSSFAGLAQLAQDAVDAMQRVAFPSEPAAVHLAWTSPQRSSGTSTSRSVQPHERNPGTSHHARVHIVRVRGKSHRRRREALHNPPTGHTGGVSLLSPSLSSRCRFRRSSPCSLSQHRSALEA